VPHGPLARFLAHPGAWWKELGNHVAHLADRALPVAALVVVAVAVLAGAVAFARLLARLRPRPGGRLVEVAVPAAVDSKAALAFWRNLHPVLSGRRLFGQPGYVAFEVEGSVKGVGLRFWAAACVSAPALARAVCSAWPGAQCRTRDAGDRLLAGSTVTCGELRLAAPAWLPLGTDHAVDPLRTVLGALPVWHDSERGLVQVLVRPAPRRAASMLARAARSLQTGRPIALVPRLLAAWRTAPARPPVPDPFRSADARHALHKASDLPGFEVAVRYGLSCTGHGRRARRRLRTHARELTAAFGVYAGRNHLVARQRLGCRRRLERRVFSGGHVLGLSEVAALAHLPYDERLPGLERASAALVAPPPGVLVAPDHADGAAWDDDDAGL
jgi:hypothetical protein